jgi:hypothetical protein
MTQEPEKEERKKGPIDRVGIFKRLPIDPGDFVHYTPEV